MAKIPFHISATKQGAKALIRITGVIGWDTDAEAFRLQIDDLVKQGVSNAHIYINSPGGSCFDASEIVNIISAFKGMVTGEGGALVASAATYIAQYCSTFTMPENGMFMIHRPSGVAAGTVSDMESYLKLMQDIDKQYYDVYKAKATHPEELERQWNKGDWWMTALETKENGFIHAVQEKIKIDKETTALIKACGCPDAKIPIINNNNKFSNDMDLRAMAKALGLPETATEAEINSAIAAGQKAQTDLADLQAENARKEKAARQKQINADVAKAINEKRITADMADKWKKALEADYDTNIELLNAISPVTKIPVKKGESGLDGSTAAYQGKTFEQLQDEDPEALAELEKNDPEAFQTLFEASLKRK